MHGSIGVTIYHYQLENVCKGRYLVLLHAIDAFPGVYYVDTTSKLPERRQAITIKSFSIKNQLAC